MTRTIKFRAIHIPDNKIRYDITIAFCNEDIREYRIYENDVFHPGEEIRYTRGEYLGNDKHWYVSQSTGLLDKNGKEIYEGDILKISHSDGSFVVIKYEGAEFFAEDIITHGSWHWGIWNRDEIIGNIYQDSHLLKN